MGGRLLRCAKIILCCVISAVAPLAVSFPQSSPISGARNSVVLMRPVGAKGLAGGTVASADGVVTCAHAVAGWDAATVEFFDGRTCKGEVVRRDVTADLALVRIEAKGVSPLVFGIAEVGDRVWVIGHPYGLSWTVAGGTLGATGRKVELPNGTTLAGMIQMDAPVNPGSSGGPLLNGRGELVGIVCAMRDGGNGIGFAISSEQVKKFLK